MKHITINRAFIAFMLIYIPIAVLGSTESYWEALKTLVFIACLIALGYYEGRAMIKEKE